MKQDDLFEEGRSVNDFLQKRGAVRSIGTKTRKPLKRESKKTSGPKNKITPHCYCGATATHYP